MVSIQRPAAYEIGIRVVEQRHRLRTPGSAASPTISGQDGIMRRQDPAPMISALPSADLTRTSPSSVKFTR
jgi:hypothetical protein